MSDAALQPDGGAADIDADGFDDTLAVVRVTPARGGYPGGDRVILRGAGFAASDVVVRFGDVPAPQVGVRRIDPNRLEVITPPHPPRVVDVSVEVDGATSVLAAGFAFDSVSVRPGRGPLSGGTAIVIESFADVFAPSTIIRFGSAECRGIAVESARRATCRTPPGAEGAVDVALEAAGADADAGVGAAISLPDAYVYENPYRTFSGLGGGSLEGTITVLVRGADLAPLSGAVVYLDTHGPSLRTATTGSDGTASFSGDDVRGRVDVYASHSCAYGGQGFLALDASVVTMQLDAVNDCDAAAPGGPPSAPAASELAGEIVFYDGQEFPTPVREWVGVPVPGPGQERVAYVAVATNDGIRGLTRVTESDAGPHGYSFRAMDGVVVGTAVPCAVAGLERTGAGGEEGSGFEPYVIGLGSPVVLSPLGLGPIATVEIRMDTALVPGRPVSVSAPRAASWAGGLLSDGTVRPLAMDRIELGVAYSVMASVRALGLGEGFSPETLESGAAEALMIRRQPAVVGSFALVEQVVWATVTAGADWDEESGGFVAAPPSTSVAARVRPASAELVLSEFLALPQVVEPAMSGGVLGRERVIRFDVDPGASFSRIRLGRSAEGYVEPRWLLLGHQSARSLRIPDAENSRGPLVGRGSAAMLIEAVDVGIVDFDRIDTSDVWTLPLRRHAQNVIAFSVE